MPLVTTTIEDTSPLIAYSNNDWRAGSSTDDPFAERYVGFQWHIYFTLRRQTEELITSYWYRYSQSSFMVTNGTEAEVSFTFYGTGVQLWGAKRPNHGYYQISIDSWVYPQVNGATNDTQFQISLFSSIALQYNYHTVKMKNVGRAFLDLDTVCIAFSVPLCYYYYYYCDFCDNDWWPKF